MLRLPVAVLGLLMVWCSLFWPYVAKLHAAHLVGWLGGGQFLVAVLIWVAGSLDPGFYGQMIEAEPGLDGEVSIKLSDLAGKSPVGCSVLAFAVFATWLFALIHDTPLLLLQGWSWALLHISVTNVSRKATEYEP